jgi:hypothetical protein
MEFVERKKFDFYLSNYCMNRIGWNPSEDEQTMKENFSACIQYVLRAETIFRGHMLNPAPG